MMAPRLIVDGQHLVKPNGKRIVLRGVNWGSWGENMEADADDMVAMGANCVRLPMARWWGLYGGADVDARDDKAYAFLRRENIERSLRELDWLTARGLWVVLMIDSNCGQSGTQGPNDIAYCDPYGVFGPNGRNFFTDHPLRQVFKSIWRHVAARVRSIPNVAMFELLPEPLGGRGVEWAAPLREFYRELIAAVREVDAETPFLIGPRNSYEPTIIEEIHLPERNDVVYTGNFLSGKLTQRPKFDAALDALTDFRAAHTVPVFVQQMGRKSGDDPDLMHMQYALERFNAEKIAFTWWQHKQNTTNPEDYALRYKDSSGGWTPKDDEISLLSAALTGTETPFVHRD